VRSPHLFLALLLQNYPYLKTNTTNQHMFYEVSFSVVIKFQHVEV